MKNGSEINGFFSDEDVEGDDNEDCIPSPDDSYQTYNFCDLSNMPKKN